MHTRKGTSCWHVLERISTPDHSWRTFLVKCLTIMLALTLSPNCEAQCSTPTASLTTSTNSQLLYSSNYPSSYPDDTTCSWLITSPVATGRIQLRVVHDNFSCCCDNDYLLIKDGSDSSARPIAILCSELNPVTLTSSGPAIYGEFHSDGDGQTGLGYAVQFDYFDSNVSCPSGWIERDTYCYRLYNDALPWQQAASRCGYDGGFLTSIVDEEENDFLVDSFRNLTSLAWIGIDSAGNWLDRTNRPYNNFTNGSPSDMDCAVIDLDSDDGRWRVSDCVHQQLPFICKKTQDGTGVRYWTDVTVSDKEDESPFSPISVIVAVIAVMVVFGSIFRSRSNQANRANRNSGCSQFCTCICASISACSGAVGRMMDACFSCSCLRRVNQSEETEMGGTPTDAPPTYESRVSLEEVQTPTENLASSGSNDQSQSTSAPPSYGAAISEAPPPSYNEALDVTYDCEPTATGGPAEVSLDVGGLAAAPSYESVVGSETNQTSHLVVL